MSWWRMGTYATESGGGSRPTLQQLLVDETLRRWEPEEDQTRRLAIPRPQTPAELKAFLWDMMGIRLPEVSVCPGHSNPFAAVCDSYFAATPVVVWKASRGFGGKSQALSALTWAEAVAMRASVSLLGGSGEQAKRVHEYLEAYWQRPGAPTGALASDPSGTSTRLIWGNKVTALMASQRAVSGPHPQRLNVDEVDLVDLALLDQSFGQPMEKDGVEAAITLSSAHYEPDGTFTEVLRRAREMGWKVHEWCWRECLEPHGWLSQRQVNTTRNMVTIAMWNVQYDLQEPSPEGRAIDPDKVERMFLGPELEATGEEFPYREFEPPVPNASYATGADWAGAGRKAATDNHHRDYVEIVTFRTDVLPMRLVAYQKFTKKPSPYILAQFAHQTGRYPGNNSHDATGGGTYLDDFMDDGTEGFVMVGMKRRALFTNYVVAVEHEEIVSPRIGTLYRQHKFCRNADLWSPAGHPPDGVVAASLAHHSANTSPLRLVVTGVTPKRPGMDQPPILATGADGQHILPPTPPVNGFARALAFLAAPTNGTAPHVDTEDTYGVSE